MEKADKIKKFSEIIKASDNIVFLGGAGVSTESGIPDFRSAEGLYNQKLGKTVSAEEIVSHDFYESNKEDFYSFLRAKLIYPDALPNDCHLALARLEQMGKLKAIVTQNIDELHQKAGSKYVIEIHGSINRAYCERCNKRYGFEYTTLGNVPQCKCGGNIRPDVVLYNEPLDQALVTKAVSAIAHADTLVIGGTSLVVYPAAGLVRYFGGKNLVIINMMPTRYDSAATLLINEKIGETFKEVMKLL